MTDRPILFSGPMVQALLDGRKTVTRRVLKSTDGKKQPMDANSVAKWFWNRGPDGDFASFAINPEGLFHARLPCWLGDRLWVRETWRTHRAYDDLKPSEMGGEEPILYLADSMISSQAGPIDGNVGGRTRPGIFMPRWTSRLTLTVQGMNVERLHDITSDSAEAEGLLIGETDGGDLVWSGVHQEYPIPEERCHHCPEEAFAELWDHVNGNGAWNQNPWVIAIHFQVHTTNIDQMDTTECKA